MTDLISLVRALRRPRLLIRAARFGLQDYNRDTTLRRLIKTAAAPSPGHAVRALLTAEAELEGARVAGDARYSVARHVEVLIALLGEASLIARPAA